MSQGTPKRLKVDSSENIYQVHKYQVLPIMDRGIDTDTANKYEVRAKVSGEDGTTHLAHYFPYCNDKGSIIGYKKRDLTKSKKNSFSSIGEVSERSMPFGYQTLGKDKWKLVICEGEYDAMFVHRALTAYNRKKGNDDKGVHVISVATGAPNAASYLMAHTQLLRQYKEIVLVFDSDEAGLQAVNEVSLALPDYPIKYVKLPLKDPIEMSEAGRHSELVQDILFNAMEYKPETLIKVEGTQEEFDEISTPLPRGQYIDFLPNLSDCLKGLRENEMSIMLAPTKCGKSTIARQMAFELGKKGNKVGMFFLEESAKTTKQHLIALYNGVRPATFMTDPSCVPEEKRWEALNWMRENFIFHDASVTNEIVNTDDICKTVKHCVLLGYKYIMFDHISFVLSGDTDGNERKKIDNLLHTLSIIARNYPVHIWAIAHITRNRAFSPERDPETKEIIYPYWLPVKKEDGRGSGAFEQLAHSIICLEPEILDEDGTKGNVRLVVRANRTWGEERVCDVLTYDTIKGVLT